MRPVPLLAALTLSLLARLSAAATTAASGIQLAGRVPKLSGRYTEMEPSAMFSERQLLERPTRAKGRRLAARASAKPLQYDHVIEVKKTNGKPVGFLDNNYVLTTDPSEALHLAAPDSSPADLVFASSSSRKTVGLVVHPFSGNDEMKSGLANFLVLTNSEAIAAGSTPTKSTSDYNESNGIDQKGETAVWYHDYEIGYIEPHWINPDGSTATMNPLVDDETNYVYLTADAKKFRSTVSGSFTDVVFDLIPLSQSNPFIYTIAAYDVDNHRVGYFDKNYVITTDQSKALAVASPRSDDYDNLEFAFSGRNSVGLVVDPQSGSDSMDDKSSNSLILTNSEATSANSAPVLMKNDYNDRERKTQKGESAVWKYNPGDNSLNIVWVNPTPLYCDMFVLVQDVTDYISVVGDVKAFKTKFGDKYKEVTLKLEKFS